ncbi:MAG TPA: hypothetical protein VGX16_07005, partial [Solirubrobacteraceae bacterium]|nr:hypothetical protein [Solirubrobacteraceae bacterium]
VTPARLREALDAWASAGGPSGVSFSGHPARARRLAELYEGYERGLEELGCVDGDRRVARALDALRREPALWGGTPVLLYGFDDLTPQQLDAVETIGHVLDAPLTLSLPYEPGRLAFAGRASTVQTLLPLAAEHRVLPPRSEHYAEGSREALHHLERSLFEPGEGHLAAGGVVAEERVGPDGRGVARVEPGGAVRLLEGGDLRAELELVAGEIRALLDSGVPASEIALAHRSPATIADVLAGVLRDFEVPFLFERRTPLAHTAVGRALCGLLRCMPARAGSGRDAFSGDRAGTIGDLLAWLRAPKAEPETDLAPVDRLEARARVAGIAGAERARGLWESEHGPIEALARLTEAAGRGPGAVIAALQGALEELRGATPPEVAALEAVARVLEELHGLARATPALAPGTAALIGVLEGMEVSCEADPEADGVAVLDPLSLRARRVWALFVCGMQEGVFPAPARFDPLLSAEDRRALAESSDLLLGRPEDAQAAERYLFYATVSRAEGLLALSFHTADGEGSVRVRSLFVEDVLDLFTEDLEEGCVRRAAGALEWPGPGVPPPSRAAREPVPLGAAGSPPPRMRPLGDDRLLEELREGRLWSASSLEIWVGCPA